jgi:hypothetical protein
MTVHWLTARGRLIAAVTIVVLALAGLALHWMGGY